MQSQLKPILAFITSFLVLSIVLSLTACKGLKYRDIQKAEPTKVLLISNHKVECTSLKIDLCLQIKQKGTKNWIEHAAEIKNFTYEWGYDYELEVTYEELSPTPTDRPKTEYTLKKTVSKSKTATTELFKLNISRDKTADLIKKANNTTYKIYNEILVTCEPADECTSLQENITQDNAIKLILSHNTNLNLPLKISSIACSSARSSFKTDCK